jgi:hypothetical protein
MRATRSGGEKAMTRTISFITVIVGAALLLAAPAVADDWGADRRSEAMGYLNPDSADRAATLGQEQFALMLDARERSQTAKRDAQLASASSPDLRRLSAPTTAAATSSGRLTDLLQVGLGFGIGVLLTIGLFLAVRFTRVHRLAH